MNSRAITLRIVLRKIGKKRGIVYEENKFE